MWYIQCKWYIPYADDHTVDNTVDNVHVDNTVDNVHVDN